MVACRDGNTIHVRLLNSDRNDSAGFSFTRLEELSSAIAVLEAASDYLKTFERRRIADAIDASMLECRRPR